MRITWLLENTEQIWGGVKVALEDANRLQRRGHQVTVLSRSGPPRWMRIECAFRQVQDFRSEHLPDADVTIATFWTTLPWAASAGAGKGVPVHFCQGYEGDAPEHGALRERIEAAYRLPGVQHVTIAPHLTRLLQQRFGITAHEVPYVVDHDVHRPGAERPAGSPLRVGLVGPYQIAWKDLATGFAACRLAHAAGQKLVLVRATNTAPAAAERDTPFAVEWHHQVPPARMGEFYRSLDLFLGTSNGADEGFFLPAVEAMANGVPTILTDVPCFRDHAAAVGDANYALFVPPGDPAAMAEALVVAGGMPDVRGTLRERGLALAALYHPDRHIGALETVLQRCAALAPATAPAAAGAAREPAPLRLVGGDRDEPPALLTDLRAQLCAAGERLLRDGQPGPAADALAAAACLSHGDPLLEREVAAARLQAGDHTGALRTCDDLVARGIDDEALQVQRGHALHAMGRMAEAAQAFRAALALGARTADAYNRLGVVLFQAGDVVGARRSFERALMLEPQHGDALANLAALPAA
ncbi:MAG: glycosyltransferase [Planctomycetes bacterium]|nr:glycosyltransferase [Planctomycetota bacterium]